MDSSDPTLSRVDVQTDYYHFGGTLLFADEQWMVPYLSLTAGATRFSAERLRFRDQVLDEPRRRRAPAVQ